MPIPSRDSGNRDGRALGGRELQAGRLEGKASLLGTPLRTACPERRSGRSLAGPKDTIERKPNSGLAKSAEASEAEKGGQRVVERRGTALRQPHATVRVASRHEDDKGATCEREPSPKSSRSDLRHAGQAGRQRAPSATMRVTMWRTSSNPGRRTMISTSHWPAMEK